MYRTERLSLLLTPAEKAAVVQMAEAEGGLSQSALVRRLIHNAARERGVWPPDKPKHTIQHIPEVQRGQAQDRARAHHRQPGRAEAAIEPGLDDPA